MHSSYSFSILSSSPLSDLNNNQDVVMMDRVLRVRLKTAARRRGKNNTLTKFLIVTKELELLVVTIIAESEKVA